VSRFARDVVLATIGSALLLSEVVIHARSGDVSAVVIGAGLACLGVPMFNRLRNGNGNGGSK